MPASKWSDNAQALSASGGSHWPGNSGSRQAKGQPTTAHAAQLQHAESLLVELYQAIQGLGEALIRAGFPASAWRAPEARLSTLGNQLPTATLEAFLARLADFAQESGPAWLARGGEALDAFEREVQVLLEIARPLGALTQRQHTLASAVRGQRSLKLAFQDERVGAQLDLLTQILQELVDLAPQEGDGAEPRWLLTGRAIAGQEPSPDARSGARKGVRWPGSRLLLASWARRRARVGLAILVLALTLAGALVLLHTLSASSASPAGPSPSGQALASVPPGRGSTPSPARASAAVTPTHAPVRVTIAVRPGNVVLTCSGSAVPLTVSNSGGQTLTWQASVSGSAILSVTSGSVGPRSQATITVHATGAQRGTGSIAFTSNGGTAKVSFKVFCR